MQKWKLSSLTVSPRRMLSTGFAAMLFAAGVLTMPVTKSARTTIADRLTPGQEEKKPAQPASNTETVETRLTKLFDICQTGDADAAAAYFVYRGPDKSRKWKDTYRARDPFEKAEVKDICLRIKGYLDESKGYRFGEVKVEREAEGEWHALEVSFRQDGQTRKILFAFLLIKGQFAIGDIDG